MQILDIRMSVRVLVKSINGRVYLSFSLEVKKELSQMKNLANKEEVKYELMGYFISNNISFGNDEIRYSTENEYNIDRFSKLLRNVGVQDFDIGVQGNLFFVSFKLNESEMSKVFDEVSIINWIKGQENIDLVRAFSRGVFLGSGSINNPENTYHLEISMPNLQNMAEIVGLLSKFDINLKQTDNYLYIKDGEEISKFLAFIGANKSVLKFEEIRVQKYMNNKINRLVNCKTANLNKIINASVEQIDAIKKLKELGEFEKLDDSLKEIADLRIQYPDISLVELGQKLKNPIGKSGVNYRLKKIIQISKTY